ncbi:MAG: sulfite exporter TauE/SafE family protein [Holophagales bacterium]|nr:sulfite exporter TauE/SafE family protein [Holophagales bacterium]
MSPWILVVVSFFSSALTAVLGIGGGVLLIALMPGLLPAAAIVPVHGVVQLASNVSRAYFARTYIAWQPVLPFAAGAILGAAAGSRFVVALPERWLPLLLGSFILIVTWLPVKRIRWPGRFFTIGAVQTFVSLFVGAAGPLVSPLLLREGYEHHRIVATHGTVMSLLHAMKTATFVLLGFSFAPYWLLILGMLAAVTAGSWAGNQLRHRLPQDRLKVAFRILLTALALRLLLRFAFG